MLHTRSDACSSINELRVFLPELRVDAVPDSLRLVGSTYAFADWIDADKWRAQFVFANELVRVYTARFAAACAQAPECAYDAAQRYDTRASVVDQRRGSKTFPTQSWLLLYFKITTGLLTQQLKTHSLIE